MKPISFILIILSVVVVFFSSCKDIIEPSINKKQVTLRTPGDQYQSSSYTINFWWDPVEDALSYHLQVVTPDFNNIGSLALDTIVTSSKFSVNLSPGNYQWRVMAENGSSHTPYSATKNFIIAQSSIKQQSVRLASPANNFLTNQAVATFQWGNLYGATKYQLEIDTNNFIDENSLVYNQTIPGQQINFTFPKDQLYQWRVRAANDTAQALWSGINRITYDHTPPEQINIIAPANNQSISLPIALQWNAVTSASKYKLYVFKSDSTTNYNSTFPLSLNTTNYSFSLGTSGERIYWKVTAIDEAGNEGKASILRSFVLR